MPNNRTITLEGFLHAFQRQDQQQPDKPFCFILGAGASKSSGIRTGGELAKTFLDDIHRAENHDELPLEQWATAERLDVKDFSLDRSAEFYPQLYKKLFGDQPDRGYAFLEQEMVDKEPSYGYSVLAWILESTAHKVVITTNFDNLVADAISIHSATFPRVVGHDSLAGFIKAALRRPLIAKVHGDLGFAPCNTPDEIEQLSENWKEALARVFERFTPIVIGYAGNDGSLMTTLESLPDGVPECLYWCQREGDAVTDRVQNLIERRKGNLVVIPGFDELMLLLEDQMREPWKVPHLLDAMKDRQRRREDAYQKQRDVIGVRLTARKEVPASTSPPMDDSVEDTNRRRELADAARRTLAPKDREKPWWIWDNEARAEDNADKCDEIYQRGLQMWPESNELMTSYANVLFKFRKNYDLAETYYQKAMNNEPEHPVILSNYAIFLSEGRKDYDRAEVYFKKALANDPERSNTLVNYALFLTNARKDHDRAEVYYKKALANDPEQPRLISRYAHFLASVRKDHGRAEEYFRKSLKIDSENTDTLANYAFLLETVRKDYDRAEKYYQKALKKDPEHAVLLGNYAGMLFVRDRKPEAEKLLQRAEAYVGDNKKLDVELLFFRIAHDVESWPEKLRPLRTLLVQGVREPNMALEENIKRAEQDGHPNPALLRALAKVITDQSPITSLDEFEEWRCAAE